MMTGLFMSCFLIGALWFVIGIGDTVVFRDKMQEATDHGAFASAALHAKGMNFIALCNLVLLAAVTIHIILGIIHDIALAICIVSLGFSCGFWLKMRKVYTGYFNGLKPAAKAIHIAEVVASYGYPVMGLIEGIQTGASYGGGRGTSQVVVVPMSTSLLPGRLTRIKGITAADKEGLPVSSRPMSYLCRKIVNVGFTAIFNKALGVSPSSPGGVVLGMAKTFIGTLLEFRYCNSLGNDAAKKGQTDYTKLVEKGNGRIDEENAKIAIENANKQPGDPIQDQIEKAKVTSNASGGGIDPGFDPFWGEKGPMVVFPLAANGNEWFQTYAFNIMPRMTDSAESRVGISRGTKQGMQKYEKSEGPGAYFAQSEFYFDCDKAWGDVNCNYEDNSAFQIKWRARLRRVSPPNIADMLVGMGIQVLINIPKYKEFKFVSGSFGDKVSDLFGNPGIVGMTTIRILFGYVVGRAEGAVTGEIRKASGKAAPQLEGVYH